MTYLEHWRTLMLSAPPKSPKGGKREVNGSGSTLLEINAIHNMPAMDATPSALNMFEFGDNEAGKHI